MSCKAPQQRPEEHFELYTSQRESCLLVPVLIWEGERCTLKPLYILHLVSDEIANVLHSSGSTCCADQWHKAVRNPFLFQVVIQQNRKNVKGRCVYRGVYATCAASKHGDEKAHEPYLPVKYEQTKGCAVGQTASTGLFVLALQKSQMSGTIWAEEASNDLWNILLVSWVNQGSRSALFWV